ncbi:hypothetical protein X975_24008, partial [Stegodyphus mimosarum]
MILVMMILSVGVKMHMSWILIGCSRLICLHLGPETMVIGNIVDFSVNSSVVCETITSLNMATTITTLFSVLRTMMVFYVVTEMIWMRMVMVMVVVTIMICYCCNSQSTDEKNLENHDGLFYTENSENLTVDV